MPAHLAVRSTSQRRLPLRRSSWPGWLAAIGLLLTPGLAAAQRLRDQPSTAVGALRDHLAKTGDLTLRDISLSQALFMISDIWDVSLVVGEAVEGKVNGVFKNAPLHDVLDAILLSNGYGYRPVGNSLVVMKLTELGDINPMFESAAIAVTNGSPSDILESVRLLCSPQGKLQAIESAKSLVVLDYPDRVQAIRRFVAELDAAGGAGETGGAGRIAGPLEVANFAPQFVPAANLKESVNLVLSADGKVSVMPLENRLVVIDFAPRLRLVKQVIDQLDVPRPQVRITVLIYDISMQDVEKLGINWNSIVKGRPDASGDAQSIFSIDSLTQSPAAEGASHGALTFMNLSRNIDLTAVIQAINECKDSRLLADPNVTVLENEAATISIVTQIPYQQLTQTQQGGNIGTTSFKEAGIKLNVTPHVSSDDTIQMEVNPEFSRLTGYTPGATPQPIIDKRDAKTVVRVANMQTLVIGGLRQRRDIGDFTGVPGLKNIRGLGLLFRSRQTSLEESELVVFLRPEIVTPYDPGRCREVAARKLSDGLLDQVPAARGPVVDEHNACPVMMDEDDPLPEMPPGEVLPSPEATAKARSNMHAASLSRRHVASTSHSVRFRRHGPTDREGAAASGESLAGTGRPSNTAQRDAQSESTPGRMAGKTDAHRADPLPAPVDEKRSFWEKLFGSEEHPDALLVEREPVRTPFEERFRGGNLFQRDPPAPASKEAEPKAEKAVPAVKPAARSANQKWRQPWLRSSREVPQEPHPSTRPNRQASLWDRMLVR